MTSRNVVWLVAIVVVGSGVGLTVGWVWGLLAAGVTLVISETIERSARRRRLAARGAEPVTPLRGALRRKGG